MTDQQKQFPLVSFVLLNFCSGFFEIFEVRSGQHPCVFQAFRPGSGQAGMPKACIPVGQRRITYKPYSIWNANENLMISATIQKIGPSFHDQKVL